MVTVSKDGENLRVTFNRHCVNHMNIDARVIEARKTLEKVNPVVGGMLLDTFTSRALKSGCSELITLSAHLACVAVRSKSQKVSFF